MGDWIMLIYDSKVKWTLTFGQSINGGGLVTEEDINDFLQMTVAPRFDAFSVNYGVGFWQGNEEENFSVTIIAGKTEENRIAEIAGIYNRTFRQDCVLIEAEPIAVCFYSGR